MGTLFIVFLSGLFQGQHKGVIYEKNLSIISMYVSFGVLFGQTQRQKGD